MVAYRIAPLCILITTAVFLGVILPRGTESVDYGTLSPDSLPKWIAYAIIVFAIIDLISPTASEDGPPPSLPEAVRAALIFVITLVAVYLMPFSGFLIPSIALATITAVFTGERRPVWLIVSGTVTPVAIWFLVTGPLDRVLP